MTDPKFPIYMTPGTYDAVVNGELVTNLEPRVVYVESQSDLTQLPAGYAPGTTAVTYDLASVWVKQPDGTWAET